MTTERTMTLNMGPQHPSTHGVLRLVLKLAGETVLGLTPVVGYVLQSSASTPMYGRFRYRSA